MKTLIPCCILLVCVLIQTRTAVSDEKNARGEVVRHSAPGNLEVTTELECLELKSIPKTVTPPDIFTALQKCLNMQEYDNAAALFALASLYARFDEQRVADPSARQATQVLQQRAFEDLPAQRKQEFMRVFKRLVEQDSQALRQFCDLVRGRGMPEYYPRYMVQHGLQAFLEPTQANRGLLPDLNRKAIWEETLQSYLHCSAR